MGGGGRGGGPPVAPQPPPGLLDLQLPRRGLGAQHACTPRQADRWAAHAGFGGALLKTPHGRCCSFKTGQIGEG